MSRMTKVEAALSWAYQNGYTIAYAAAQEYAAGVGCTVGTVDGGLYTDWLSFADVEVAPEEEPDGRDAAAATKEGQQ